jgi:hypothetical protein
VTQQFFHGANTPQYAVKFLNLNRKDGIVKVITVSDVEAIRVARI